MSPSAPEPGVEDATRRTRLAAERTWLAWWRTGLATSAAAIAVGRLIPGLTHGDHWAFRLLGLGYAVLAIVLLLIGGVRQYQGSQALDRGEYHDLSPSLVIWLTAAAVALAGATLVIVAVAI